MLRLIVLVVLVSQTVFRSGADVVWVNVSVMRGKVPVTGLASMDFEVFDNGVRQAVSVAAMSAVPIDITVVLESSDDVAGRTSLMQQNLERIRRMVGAEDRIRFLVSDDRVREVFGWRSKEAEFDLGSVGTNGIGASVADALVLAMLHQPDPDRRHFVFAMTRNVGTQLGVLDSRAVRDVAARSEAVLYIAFLPGGDRTARGFATVMWYRGTPDVVGSNFKDAAEQTGGRFYDAPVIASPDRIVTAFEQGYLEFRRSYLLYFVPAGVARSGWHDLRVTARGATAANIRARKGYFGG